MDDLPEFLYRSWVLRAGAVNERVKEIASLAVVVQRFVCKTALNKVIPLLWVATLTVEESLNNSGNITGCSYSWHRDFAALASHNRNKGGKVPINAEIGKLGFSTNLIGKPTYEELC